MSIIFKILYTIFFVVLFLEFLKFVLIFLLMALALLWFRTWQMKKEPNQKDFLAGKLPNPKPDGLYNGNMGFNASWVGKKFNAENSAGINLFKDKKGRYSFAPGSSMIEKYPFKTYVGKGLFDEDIFVLKLDYNMKGNPFWVRWIVDEMVETSPNEYLGKMHVKIIPGLPFSILFFELKK